MQIHISYKDYNKIHFEGVEHDGFKTRLKMTFAGSGTNLLHPYFFFNTEAHCVSMRLKFTVQKLRLTAN